MEGNWTIISTRNALIVAANISDNLDEFSEIGGFLLVILVWCRPGLGNKHAVGPTESLPNCFGNEWRERMQHGENLLESGLEEISVFPELFGLNEPVGIFVPNEIVDEVAGLSETIMVEKFLEFGVSAIDLLENPVFAKTLDFDISGIGWIVVDDILNKAGDVPDFIAEIAAGHDFASAKGLINAGGATSDKAKAECIGAIFGDDLDWIDDITFRLGHFLAFFVEDHAMHIDIFEWNVVGNIKAEHNHAANPLE